MPSCAVASCRHTHRTKFSHVSNKVLHFHRFPSNNEKISKLWAQACNRGDDFKCKNAVICGDHFREPEDYERNLKAELLGLQIVPRLKADVVPTLHLTCDGDDKTETEVKSNKIRKKARKRKEVNSDAEEQEMEVKVEVEGIPSPEVIISDASLPTSDFNSNDLAGSGSELPNPVMAPSGQSDKEKLESVASSSLSSAVIIPDKTVCLICYSKCSKSSDASGGFSSLTKHLTSIFLLRKVIELPLTTVENYLTCNPSPEEWIRICHECSDSVRELEKAYNGAVENYFKFINTKRELIGQIKSSVAQNKGSAGRSKWRSITDESRQFVTRRTYEYGQVRNSNPFEEGDRMAEELATGKGSGSMKTAIIVQKDPPKTQIGSKLAKKKRKQWDFAANPTKSTTFTDIFHKLIVNQEPDATISPVTSDKPKIKTAPVSVRTPKRISHPFRKSAVAMVTTEKEEAVKEEVPDFADEEMEMDDVNEDNSDTEALSPPPEDPLNIDLPDFKKYYPPRNILPFSVNIKNYSWEVSDDDLVLSSDDKDKEEDSGGTDKLYVVCPLCEENKFEAEKSEELCQHMESCSSSKISQNTKSLEENLRESGEATALITCPICHKFKSTVADKISFCEHIGICRRKGDLTLSSEPEVTLDSRIFQCDVCEKTKFMKINRFILHYLHHKKKKRYDCVKCPKIFNSRHSCHAHFYKKHLNFVQSLPRASRYKEVFKVPTIPWWCPFPSCNNQQFASEQSRNQHIQSSHNQDGTSPSAPTTQESPQHKCPTCKKYYYSEHELQLHTATTHIPINKFISCDICFKVFQSLRSLNIHRMEAHNLGYQECHLCDRKYKSRLALTFHRKNYHEDNHKAELTCTYCSKTLSTRSSLRQHISAIHKKIIRFTCQICPRGFCDSSSYRRHMFTLHKIGSFPRKVWRCTMEGCKRQFASKASFNCHQNEHKKDPQYKCMYCGKDFYYPDKLRRHELIHTNPDPEHWPFQCDKCPKKFLRKDLLQHHLRNHDSKPARKFLPKEINDAETKPYVCSFCGVSCEGPRFLNRHLRDLHSDQIRKCEICEKMFKSEAVKVQHVKRIHEGKLKRVCCQYCGKSYVDFQLTRHYRQMHKDIYDQLYNN